MKRFLPLWQLIGFLFTSLGGTLLHFLYDWTGQSLLVAPFSAVNESTWEHMKLLFFPMFIFALIQSQIFPVREDFWCVKLVGTLSGLTLIPVLFYTYNGAFGQSPDWVNIAIFFVSVAVAYLVEARLFNGQPLHFGAEASDQKKTSLRCSAPWLAFIFICLIALAFVHFTFFPPELPLFQDPLMGSHIPDQ